MHKECKILPLLDVVLQQVHTPQSLELWDDVFGDVTIQLILKIVVKFLRFVELIAQPEYNPDEK